MAVSKEDLDAAIADLDPDRLDAVIEGLRVELDALDDERFRVGYALQEALDARKLATLEDLDDLAEDDAALGAAV